MLGSSLVTRSRVSVWDGPGVLANRNAAITDDMRTGVWMFRDDGIRVQPLQQPSCKEDVEQRMVDQPLQPALGGVGGTTDRFQRNPQLQSPELCPHSPKIERKSLEPFKPKPWVQALPTLSYFLSVLFYNVLLKCCARS